MPHYCGNDHPASATEEDLMYSTLHWATLLQSHSYTFVLTNGFWLEGADYTTTNVDVLFLRVQLLELFRYLQLRIHW
jgi:hypothetical protein